ncbi:MAG: hypothetical protein GY835_08005 [bacterium]|nr:hypothetical protein [bacterium]
MQDWKDETHYAYTSELKRIDWAWEFLRRSPDYFRDWKSFIDIWDDLLEDFPEGPYFADKKPNPKWFKDSRSKISHDNGEEELRAHHGSKWGLKMMIDPSELRIPIFAWRGSDDEGNLLTALDAHLSFDPPDSWSRKPGHVTFIVNLNLQARPQVQAIEKEIERLQSQMGVKPTKQRNREWTRYLRILDACISRSDNLEIAQIFFPNSPDLEGRTEASRAKAEAQEWATTRYRELLFLE